MTSALAERGGQIFSTTIRYDQDSQVSPDLTPIKRSLSINYANKILGTNLNGEKIIDCLMKMGHSIEKMENDEIYIEIPAWRADILHEIDLVEDVAVGYGFDQFETDFPKALTFGKTLPRHDLYDGLRSIMIGMGFNEVTTFTISNEQDEFKKMGLESSGRVEIENPIGEELSLIHI